MPVIYREGLRKARKKVLTIFSVKSEGRNRGKIYICQWFIGRVWEKPEKKYWQSWRKYSESETLPFPSNQGLENSAFWRSRGFILVFRGMRVRLLFHFILSLHSPPLPSPRLTINQTHSGYVYSIPDSFTGLKNIIAFQLVVWASTTLILLTRGHFVLVLVNDFFEDDLPRPLPIGKRALLVPWPARNLLVPDYRMGPFWSPTFYIDMKNTPAWYKRFIIRFCKTTHLPLP